MTRLWIRNAAFVGIFSVLTTEIPAGAAPQSAGRQTLYEGAKGTTPGKQGWLFLATGGVETKPSGTGATTFSSLANPAFQGGYSYALSLPLDRKKGYTVGFDMQVLAESHGSPNRSGVSLIVLGHDEKGVELAFWTNQIWAQSDKPQLFQHAEGAALDTTAPGKGAAHLIHYDLQIRGSAYHLSADGRPILTGPVRDYTAFIGAMSPYQTPDFLFLGDDTHSAAGKFRVSRIWVKKG